MAISDKIELSLKIIAAAVAVFGVYKYFEDRATTVETAKKTESLKVIKEYSSDDLYQARKALLKFWRTQPEFSRFIASADTITQNEYSNFVRIVFPRHQQFDDVEGALFQLNEYLDSAYHCRISGLCEPLLLDGFLCERLSELNRVYGPFFSVLNQQISSHDFGRSLAEYLTVCGQKG